MTLDFTCQACDASFELELSELLEESALECPNCEARAPRGAVEGVTSALDDLFAQLALLQRKFTVVFEVESEDLPRPYGRESARLRDDEAGEGTEDGDVESEEAWEERPAEADEDDVER